MYYYIGPGSWRFLYYLRKENISYKEMYYRDLVGYKNPRVYAYTIIYKIEDEEANLLIRLKYQTEFEDSGSEVISIKL